MHQHARPQPRSGGAMAVGATWRLAVFLLLALLAFCAPHASAQGTCAPGCYCSATTYECIDKEVANLPSSIPRGKQYVDVSRNQFKTKALTRSSFTHLKGVTTLLMNDCGITSFAIDTFADLTTLTVLQMNNNPITTIARMTSQHVSSLHNLWWLSLAGCGIKSFAPNTFASMGRLLVLTLDRNPLENGYLTRNRFTGPPSLMTLHLAESNIIGFAPDAFANLGKLNQLDLSKNAFSNPDLKIANLTELGNMHSLWLKKTGIRAVEVGAFRGLTKLSVIDLSYNKLIRLEPSDFGSNVLTDISLESNMFTDLVGDWEPVFEKASRLQIGKNPFQCTCDSLWIGAVFLDNEKASEFASMPTCAGPSFVAGKRIDQLGSNELDAICDNHDVAFKSARSRTRVGKATGEKSYSDSDSGYETKDLVVAVVMTLLVTAAAAGAAAFFYVRYQAKKLLKVEDQA